MRLIASRASIWWLHPLATVGPIMTRRSKGSHTGNLSFSFVAKGAQKRNTNPIKGKCTQVDPLMGNHSYNWPARPRSFQLTRLLQSGPVNPPLGLASNIRQATLFHPGPTKLRNLSLEPSAYIRRCLFLRLVFNRWELRAIGMGAWSPWMEKATHAFLT